MSDDENKQNIHFEVDQTLAIKPLMLLFSLTVFLVGKFNHDRELFSQKNFIIEN